MEIKRYTAGEIAVATRKGNINVDDQYIRVDHAITAGVLVPVPDGEARRAEDLQNKVNAAMWNGQVVLPEPMCGAGYD